MFRRSRNRAPALVALAGAVLAAAGPASAMSAMVLPPLYAEPERPADQPAPPSADGCAVNVAELTDSRREPQTIGVIMAFRAIRAPQDRDAWLHSVVEVGLQARGFKTSFNAGEAPGAVNVRINVRNIWLTTQAMSKTASVVMRMSAAAPSGVAGEPHDYRGDVTGLNWAGSTGEFNGLAQRTFAEALDAMAADLRPLCAAGGGPAAAPAAPAKPS